MQVYSGVGHVLGMCLMMLTLGCGSGNAKGKESSGAAEKTDSRVSSGVATSRPGDSVPAQSAENEKCVSDTDCAPSDCCHGKSCVISSRAPKDCGEMMCSAECVEGTMDCGKGTCVCQEGTCQVAWRE